MKINTKNISGSIVQIGKNNNNSIDNSRVIHKHIDELKKLVNTFAYCEEQKLTLLEEVKSIEQEDAHQQQSAKNLLRFMSKISKDVVSGMIIFGLEQLAGA